MTHSQLVELVLDEVKAALGDDVVTDDVRKRVDDRVKTQKKSNSKGKKGNSEGE